MQSFDSPPTVIGLIGPMRAGKDTICQALIEESRSSDHRFVRRALADEVKREYGRQHGMSLEQVESAKAHIRADLQALGTRRRTEDTGYWISRLLPHIPNPGCGETAVVTDVRYINEAETLLDIPGAVLVRVDTPQDVRLHRYLQSKPDATIDDYQNTIQHASEMEWQYCAHHFRFPGDVAIDEIADMFWRMLDRVRPEFLVYPQRPAERPMVYIAGPISKAENLYHATGHAIRAWHMLFQLGYAPFCPYLSGPVDYVKPVNYSDWLDYDCNVISHCRAVYRLDGQSVGADIEVQHAQSLGIPVWYEGELIPPSTAANVYESSLEKSETAAA